MLVRTGLVAGASGLTLGVAEVLARAFAREPPILRSAVFTQNIAEHYDMRFDDVFVRDREAFWRLAPGVRLPDDAWPLPGLISNRQGLREDHEIPARKGDGELRILFLGDSCTFGYGLPHDQTFVHQTELRLRQAFPSLSIECINGGVPGYTLFQGWRALETRGFALHPDAVVLTFGWNELAEWDGASDLAHYERLRAETPPRPLDASRLCGLIWRALARSGPPGASARRPRLVPHEFRAVLAAVGEAASRRGVDLLLLIWPSSENLREDYRTPLQLEQDRFAAQHPFGPDGAPGAVDGVAVLREAARSVPLSALYLDPIHATATAHRALADALAARLGAWLRARVRR